MLNPGSRDGTYAIPKATEAAQIQRAMNSMDGADVVRADIEQLFERRNPSTESGAIFSSETYVEDPYTKAEVQTMISNAEHDAESQARHTQEMRAPNAHELGEMMDTKQTVALINVTTLHLDFVRNAKLNGVNDPYNLADDYGLAA